MSDTKHTIQSSRIYFRGKDHKDAYFNGLFHGAMAYKDADPSVDNVIWRKSFPDRYFAYKNYGEYEWSNEHGICYTKQKINMGIVGGEFYSARTSKYLINSQNYWADSIYISTEDEKCIKYYSVQNPISRITQYAGLNNTILARDWDYNWYFTTLTERESIAVPPTWNPLQPLATGSFFQDKGIGYPVLYVCPHGTGKLAVFRNSGKIIVWDEETQSFSNVFNDPHGSVDIRYANGRIFILCRYNWINTGIYEIIPSGIVRVGTMPWISGESDAYFLAMRYADGIYYLYVTYTTTNRKPYVFSSSDLANWTAHTIKSEITIKPLPADAWRGNQTILTNESFTYNKGIYTPEYIEREFPMFENGKRVKNPYDIAMPIYYSYGNSNYLMCYFDNPFLEESEGNFYFFSSDVRSAARPQEMWTNYYREDT